MYFIIWMAIIKTCVCSQYLLFATNKDIRMLNLTRVKKPQIIVSDLHSVVGIDYFYDESLVCWSDNEVEEIKCMPTNETYNANGPAHFRISVLAAEGIACDWLTKKIYWVDNSLKKIEVISLKTQHRKVLIWEDLDQPRGIAVDPLSGYLFWTDWGEIPKIERCSMDGALSTRKIIINEHVFWPNSICLDVIEKKLYWVDAHYHLLEVCDYDGKNRKTLIEHELSYPYSMTRIRDTFFWTDWRNNSIFSYNITSGGHASPIYTISSEDSVMGIEALGASFQPSKPTPCDINNGGCSHLCLLSSQPPGYSCDCPTGILIANKTTCSPDVNHLLLLVQRAEISNISLDTLDFTNFKIPLHGLKRAMNIDYDPIEKYIYWTDDEMKNIQRSKLDGSKQENIVSSDMLNLDGIAIDWVARNMYWSNVGANRIEVQRLNTTFRKAIIIDNIKNPRAVAVVPQKAWLYWSDWGETDPKIERTDLDGSNRIIIVKDNIKWPNGIAIDLENSKLYFADAGVDSIEEVNMNDGGERRIIVNDNMPHVYGITTQGNYLYWTDWQARTLERVNKVTGQDRRMILDNLHDVMGIKAVNLGMKLGTNACADRNGNCDQLCFHKPSQKVLCACQIDYELAADNKRCTIPEAFLVIYSNELIRRVSVQNKFASEVIPITGIKSISAIDVHIADSRIYWADNKAKEINRSFLNGSQIEQITDYGIHLPESLAVDWLSSNLYWVDGASKRIEVAKLNGTSRKTLFWTNLKEPANLVLDPRIGYMFWSEWDGNVGGIFRAWMDGSKKNLFITDTGKIHGLTIDYTQRTLYWSQYKNDQFSIEVCDWSGENRRQILNNRSFKPKSITQYQDYLFWVSHKDGSILRANKLYGTNATVLYSQTVEIEDLRIVHSSKQSGWNACAGNNGGCSNLCLVKPGTSELSTDRTCTCPSHFYVKNGNCHAPEHFLMYSLKNALYRLIPTAEECPDVALPITGAKNVRGVEYDPITKLIYWIDGKSQAIKRSYENGSHTVVLVNGNLSEKSYHFYDMAIDPYNKLLFWSCSLTDSINVTRLSNVTLGRVFSASRGERPRNLAVHPELGYLFWTDAGKLPRIVRAQLDGQNRLIIDTDGKNVESMTVDRTSNLLFYTYSQEIFSSDLSGKKKTNLLNTYSNKVPSMAVIDSYLYYSATYKEMPSCIERIEKLTGRDRVTIVDHVQVTDIISVRSITKSDLAGHPCSSAHRHGDCSYLCLRLPDRPDKANCSCTSGLRLEEDGKTCTSPPPCGKEQFTCDTETGECISKVWRCDGTTDCVDGSDEENCPKCANQYKCSDGSCVKSNAYCNGNVDCADGSDEEDCCSGDFAYLHPPYFQCDSDGKCLLKTALCDGVVDCDDESDEMKCSRKNPYRNETYTGDSSSSTTFWLPFILIFACLLGGFLICYFITNGKRKPDRTNLANEQDQAALRPLAPHCRPIGTLTSMGMPGSIGHSIMNGGGGSTGSYDRSHFTGASSSISMNNVPLNPPPSPATTILREECCCRNYLTPMPTPCSTDVCDESDTNYKTDSDVYVVYKNNDHGSVRYYNDRYSRHHRDKPDRHQRYPRYKERRYVDYDEAGHSLYKADYDLRQPPPTPRSISSDPPSPSSSTYRHLPGPPPPSPTN